MLVDSCLIIKNEERNIHQLIDQLCIFSHEVHITDTGSTDNTLKILKELQDQYSNLFVHNHEWQMDFSEARNYSLTCYDCTADYQFWCDGDDLLNEKLIETLQEFSNNDSYDADIYYIKYQYFDGDLNPHVRTSLLKKSANLQWNDPIHEFIGLRPELNLNFNVFDNGSLILHKKTPEDNVKCRNRNLEIFFNMEKINREFTQRNRYYYGVELMNHGLKGLAISKFHECIDNEETCYEQVYSIKRLYECGDKKLIEYALKLIKIGMCRRDMFVYMGNAEYNNGRMDMAKLYYNMCLEYPSPRNEFENFGYYVNCDIDSLLQLGLIAYNEKNYKLATEYNNKILEIDPDNNTAIKNIDVLMQMV